MEKYVQGSGDIPGAKALSENYIPKIGEERTRKNCKEDIVAVISHSASYMTKCVDSVAMARSAHAISLKIQELQRKQMQKNMIKQRERISAAEEKMKVLRSKEKEKSKDADKLSEEENCSLTEIVLAQAMLKGILTVRKDKSEMKQEVEATAANETRINECNFLECVCVRCDGQKRQALVNCDYCVDTLQPASNGRATFQLGPSPS
ncbi:hypothetical protein PR048_026508, partial [Dryococelus australis]